MNPPTMPPNVRPTRPLGVLVVLAMIVAACGDDGTTPEAPTPAGTTASATADAGEATGQPTTAGAPDDPAVQLVTHDSFNVSEEVLAAFTDETGYTVEVLQAGDAGSLVNQAVLTAGNPQGDVLFGVDNTLLSRALDNDVFVPYEPADADALDPSLVLDDQWRVTPVDRGDVCLNYDRAAFDDVDVPETLADLAEPQYAGQLVVENPATSSPGLSFLLATVATFGEDGWEDYWSDLVANDVHVSAGWEDAYYGVFSGSADSSGDRPLVVSYASSPPAEVIFAEEPLDEAPTGVITASCFQQVEFAGVLAGTDNEPGAQALVDFMVSETFQADIPLNMFVFPAREGVELPEEFVEHAAVPDDPITLEPAYIDEHREDLVQRWTELVLG